MRTYWDGKKDGFDEAIAVLNRKMRSLEKDIVFFMTSDKQDNDTLEKIKHAGAMQKACRLVRNDIQMKRSKIL